MKSLLTKKLIIYLFLLFLFISPVFGWSAKTHQKIVKEALYSLPKEYQRKLMPYIDEMLNGSIAPDRVYKDFDNHVFHIHGNKGRGPEKVRQKYLEIVSLIQEKRPWRLIAFELGVLSHYIADLNQPLHTDTSKKEDLFHSKYEKDAEVINPKIINNLVFISHPMSYIIDSILRANSYYKDIEKAYLNEGKFSNVSKITQNQIDKATYDVACYFYSALERGSRGTTILDIINDFIDYWKAIFKMRLGI